VCQDLPNQDQVTGLELTSRCLTQLMTLPVRPRRFSRRYVAPPGRRADRFPPSAPSRGQLRELDGLIKNWRNNGGDKARARSARTQ
jgi:hypothetical protein